MSVALITRTRPPRAIVFETKRQAQSWAEKHDIPIAVIAQIVGPHQAQKENR